MTDSFLPTLPQGRRGGQRGFHPPRADPRQLVRRVRVRGERSHQQRAAHRQPRHKAVEGVREDIRDQETDGGEEVKWCSLNMGDEQGLHLTAKIKDRGYGRGC